MNALHLSPVGKLLIQSAETLRLVAYLDRPGGVLTIGWGHTKGVYGGQTCTTEQANDWFYEDVQAAEDAVNRLVTVPLTQRQFDALVSFVFNVGEAHFAASTLLHLLNTNRFAEAAPQFGRWVYDDGKIEQGLVKRRASEQRLFASEASPCPSPSTSSSSSPLPSPSPLASGPSIWQRLRSLLAGNRNG